MAQGFAIILDLFITFFKIGAMGFGGGLAMLPYIEQQVSVYHHWLSEGEFLDLLAIAQSTPGPIAINSSTFVGFRTAGILGAVVACIGVIFFAVFAINLLSSFLDKNVENPRIKQLFLTLRPITVGLILAAAFTTGSKVLVDWPSVGIALVAFFFLSRLKLHPIVVVLSFGVTGALFYLFV
ncbi:chromate transporter [Gottschalkiaceae bacterium SANA]|nr:chromate transporter [Gottschalkiaceae bacterium SANA]